MRPANSPHTRLPGIPSDDLLDHQRTYTVTVPRQYVEGLLDNSLNARTLTIRSPGGRVMYAHCGARRQVRSHDHLNGDQYVGSLCYHSIVIHAASLTSLDTRFAPVSPVLY